MNVLFIDSGIGGLTTLATVVNQLPDLNFIYYADNKFAPYGNKTSKEITSRLIHIINSQIKHNIGLVVLACNTATANSIDMLRQIYKFPIIGIEPAVKPALGKNHNVLVLATPATTKHPRFAKLISKCNCPLEIVPMPNLATQIDNYYLFGGSENQQKIENSLLQICNIAKNKTHIVLGCTHYVFLARIIQKLTSATVLDGNYGVCKQVCMHVSNKMKSQKPYQKFVLSKKNTDLCKKYRKIFEQTLANVANV